MRFVLHALYMFDSITMNISRLQYFLATAIWQVLSKCDMINLTFQQFQQIQSGVHGNALILELSYIRPHISMAFWQVSPGISYWHGFSKVINDAFWRDHWYSYNQHFIAEKIIKFLIILVLEAVDERANVHCTNNWFSEIWS